MASKALDEHTEGGEPVEVEPGNSPQYDELGSSSLSDEMKKFTAAMASINLGDVAIYASQIWKSIHPDKPAEAFGVTELGSPIFGWNNMLYPVIFEDGVGILEKYSFGKGGSLLFDHQDRLSGIGSMSLMDSAAMLERLKNDDPDESPIYIEAGPFSEPKAYYKARLDHRGEQGASFEAGVLELLQMFFDSMQEPCDGRKPFVLARPDFDLQNFIVSEDGELRAIIDWDGVSSVPRTLGNERFPNWLTRDWDPMNYLWDERMEQGIKLDGILWEDSLDALKFYRSVYASAMRSHQHTEPETPPTATLTTNSLIYENLLVAADNLFFMAEIAVKVFEAIAAIVQEDVKQAKQKIESENGEEDFEVLSVLEALGENRLSEHYLEVLIFGFQKLLERSAEL